MDDFVKNLLLLFLVMLCEGLRVFKPVALGLILFSKIVFFFWLVLVEKWHIFIAFYIAKRELLDNL